MDFSGQLFRITEINHFCFVVAMSDLVHDVETIHCLCYLLTASGNLFRNMSDAREVADCSFLGITHISKKISMCLQQLINVKYRLIIMH